MQAIKVEILDKCQSKYYDHRIFNKINDLTLTKACIDAESLTEDSFTRRNVNLIYIAAA